MYKCSIDKGCGSKLAAAERICPFNPAIQVQILACFQRKSFSLAVCVCVALCVFRRDFYRQQGVPVQFTPFSKECSALWKTMTDEEKKKYQKLAEEDRERYRREVSGFDKPLAKDGTRRGRRKKEPGQPKRNM